MAELAFEVTGARPLLYATAPELALDLRVLSPAPVHSALLRCQIRIEATRREYGLAEAEDLRDLFGERARWGTTLRGLLWTHAALVVPSFTGSTTVEVVLPCSADLNVAAAKYFNALEEGEVPLTLLFSGTVFHPDAGGDLQASPVPWSKETRYRLPLRVYRDAVEGFFPNTAFVTLQRDVLVRLYRYKARRGLPSWEAALTALLARAEEAEQGAGLPDASEKEDDSDALSGLHDGGAHDGGDR